MPKARKNLSVNKESFSLFDMPAFTEVEKAKKNENNNSTEKIQKMRVGKISLKI